MRSRSDEEPVTVISKSCDFGQLNFKRTEDTRPEVIYFVLKFTVLPKITNMYLEYRGSSPWI